MLRMRLKLILCWLVLLICWLTISPLFLYLASRWNMIGKGWGIALLLISPFMLILYALVCLFLFVCYHENLRKHRFADNEVIERITGVQFPELEIVDYKRGNTSFLGDYSDCITLEMEEDLSESTYHYLDSIIDVNKTRWDRDDDEYSYEIMWGNGLPVPKGESDEEDMAFLLSMKKGTRIVTIEYGSW